MFNFNFVVGTATALCFIAALVYFLRASKKTEDGQGESIDDVDIAPPQDPSNESLVFIKKDGLSVAHKDGLVMVVVPRNVGLERALLVLSTEMSRYEYDEPGISGELFLDRSCGALDLSGWAQDQDLANQRISLHVAEAHELPLEQGAQVRFKQYLDSLKWMRTTKELLQVTSSHIKIK